MLRFFLLNIFCLMCLLADAQDGWELKKDKDGLKIFTKDLDTSKYKALKVECVLDGTIQKFDSIIRDVNNHKNWIYSTKKSNLVKVINAYEVIYYTETTLPWPFRNRDVVIQMNIKRNNENSETVTTTNVDGVVGINDGIVRVPQLATQWFVTAAGTNKINIIYYFTTDPGAGLSSWLVNTFAVKGPYETFEKLAALLKQ